MGNLPKIAFKPELPKEEQTRQRILVESWVHSRPALAKYGTRLDESIPLEWNLADFVEWFPQIVQSDFAAWRREHLDTRDIRAGTDWRCFPGQPLANGDDNDEFWLELPRCVPVYRGDRQDRRIFIMRGELWTHDHLHGEALGPAIWLTVQAKTSGVQARLGVEDFMSEQPAIASYFAVMRDMLRGTWRASNSEVASISRGGRPVGGNSDIAERNATIYQLHTERKLSKAQLAVKYNLSTESIKSIVRKERRKLGG